MRAEREHFKPGDLVEFSNRIDDAMIYGVCDYLPTEGEVGLVVSEEEVCPCRGGR